MLYEVITHTTTSGFVLAAVFVVGISSWFLLKNRHQLFAKRSIIVASTFGIVASIILIGTGDSSAKDVAKYQPMKFAAMESVFEGKTNVPLIAVGLVITSYSIHYTKLYDYMSDVKGTVIVDYKDDSYSFDINLSYKVDGKSHTLKGFYWGTLSANDYLTY